MAKRKTMTYADRVKLIEAVESAGDKKKIDIAKEFGIAANTLSTIMRNKAKYVGQPSSSKRLKGPEFKDIDACVLQWLKQCRGKNVPMSGSTVRKKATEFAKQLGEPKFCASNGWLYRFKQRNAIIGKKIIVRVDNNVSTEWTGKLLDLTRGYKPNEIFNAVETGLYYQCLPDKTLAFKGDPCHDGKNSDQRVTLLLGANQTGTVKLKPLLIGKSKNPRCFKAVQSFPMEYTHNPNAWITAKIFSKWLTDVDIEMKKKKKKILLLIDNCTVHGDVPKLKNMKVVFLPPSTSKLQPLDRGIIESFKSHYRNEVVRQFLRDLDDRKPTKINVLDAMWMASKAWNNVTAKTIERCFRKSGFKRQVEDDDVGEENVCCNAVETTTDDSVSPEQWEAATTALNFEGVTFQEFVSFDDDLAVSGEPTDADIIASVRNEEEQVWEDDGSEVEAPDPVPTVREARFALTTLRKFLQQKTAMSDQAVHSIAVLDDALDKTTLSECHLDLCRKANNGFCSPHVQNLNTLTSRMELDTDDLKPLKMEIKEEEDSQSTCIELHSEIELGKYECLVPKEEEDAADPLPVVKREPLEEPDNSLRCNSDGQLGKFECLPSWTDCKKEPPEEEMMNLGNCESPDPSVSGDTFSATTAVYVTTEPEDNSVEPPEANNLGVYTSIKSSKKRVWNKKAFCLFCGNLFSNNFTRHMIRNHIDEVEVSSIVMDHPKGSVKRRDLFEKLRKKSIFLYNKKCLKDNAGNLIVAQRPSREKEASEYLPCKYCLGFFSANNLHRHVKKCKLKPEGASSKCAKSSGATFLIDAPNGCEELEEKVFPTMRPDDITKAAQVDSLIREYGAGSLRRRGKDSAINVISLQMRELARLKIEMVKRDVVKHKEIVGLEDMIHADLYNDIVSCVLDLSGYDVDTGKFKATSMAKRFGFSLKTCAEILESKGVTTGDGNMERRAKNFSTLFDKMWKFDVPIRSRSKNSQARETE